MVFFSPYNFVIVYILNTDWIVLNLVVLDNPLKFLDSGKYKGLMYLSSFERILDLSLDKTFLFVRDSVKE